MTRCLSISRQELERSTQTASALFTNSKNQNPNSKRPKNNRSNANYKKGKPKNKNGERCSACGSDVHLEPSCFLAHPDLAPDWWKDRGKNQERLRKFNEEKKNVGKNKDSKKDSKKNEIPKTRSMMIRGLAHRVFLSRSEDDRFYVDSAATIHICKNLELFEKLDSTRLDVEVANGQMIVAKQKMEISAMVHCRMYTKSRKSQTT